MRWMNQRINIGQEKGHFLLRLKRINKDEYEWSYGDIKEEMDNLEKSYSTSFLTLTVCWKRGNIV